MRTPSPAKRPASQLLDIKRTALAASRLVRQAPQSMALEQRFMFDGAGLVDAIDASRPAQTDTGRTAATSAPERASADNQRSVVLQIDTDALDANAAQALSDAQQSTQVLVGEFLSQPGAAQVLYQVFDGGQSGPPSEAWKAAVASLQQEAAQGAWSLAVELRSHNDLQGARGAFAAQGPQGSPVVYLNADWIRGADTASIRAVLLEEVGHAIDARLNPGSDSQGDEGEAFASILQGWADAETAKARSLSSTDALSLMIDGQAIEAEAAQYAFVNAYAMVYDLNNNNTIEGNRGETAAEKEQSTHNFNPTGLGPVTVQDGSAFREFSGNDVSATSIMIGGQEYYGWISRPIKSNGQVQGFYFWTDLDFTTLALAEADGNQDGDADANDNQGFLLVVNQSWFDSRITATQTTTSDDIDGLSGQNTYARVGSSSDRVDSALNALLNSNVAPTAANDVTSGTPDAAVAGRPALEEGYNTNTSSVITPTVNATGNVLTNDTDGNGDTLSVIAFTSKSTGNSVAPAGTGSFTVIGQYGTLTVFANGNYSYAVNNSNATVNALLSGNVSEQFSYTASDSKGGTASATLTVQINGSNDAPVAADDYNTAKESTTVGGSGFASTGYSASGNVLPNDTDVDTGDGRSIVGASVSGAATSTTVSVVNGSTQLLFTGSQGFTSVNSGQELYISLTGATGNTATYYGVYSLSGSTYTLVFVQTKTAVTGGDLITLNTDPTHYWDGSSYVAITNIASLLSTYNKVLFENSTAQTENANGGKEATVSSTSSTRYTTLGNLSGLSGTIAIGMTVSGPGVPAGTTVSDLTYTGGVLTSIRLDQELTSTAGGAFTFTGGSGLGTTLQGAHGTLTLAANGDYTYTPTTDNPQLGSGDVVVEVFDYTMQDTAVVTSSAKLYITVYGTGSNDPVVATDTGTAYEAGVGRNSTSPYPLTGDNTPFAGVNAAASTIASGVLGNDTTGAGGAVTEYTKANGTGTTNVGVDLIGTYGILNIGSTGTYTYTVADGNSAVNALLPGATLTETFRYRVTNTASGSNWSTLTITIQGTNDAPVAVADTGALTEDVALSATGNVLGNDTDVDANDTKVVTRAGTTTANTTVGAGTTADDGLSINGTYGTLTLGADGTYRYVLATSADVARYAALQALTDGSTAPEVFRYEVRDTNGATSVTTLTFTITGNNEPPVNAFNGVAISSATPTTVTTALNTPLDFSGSRTLTVDDADNNLASVTLSVEHGTLSFTTTPIGSTLNGANLSAPSGAVITLTGTQAQINAAIALLRYTPDAAYAGTDFLTIASTDSLGGRDSDGIAILIPNNTAGTVDEAALPGGTNAASTAEAISGASLGLPSGQSVSTAQSGTTASGFGTWSVTTAGTYSYTLSGPVDHSGGPVTDTFSYTAYDEFGNAITNTVTVTITDDGPVASANTATVSEGGTVAGNVLTDGTDDVFGADGAKTTTPAGGVVGVRAAGSDTTTAVTTDTGTPINGLYGTLTLNANGTYSYTANSNVVTTASPDTFVYTIEDADGDRSTVTLTITVNDVPVVTPTADLNLVKTVNNASPNVGDNVTFTLTVRNDGPDAATGVTVTDQLPSGLAFVSASGTAGTYDSTTGIWSIGSLANGASATLTLVATATSAANVVNSATVDGNQTDPDATDDTSTASVDAQAADLNLVKTVNNASPNVGDNVTFTLTVRNDGPDAATGVTVTDQLPSGLAFVSASGTAGTYDSTTGIWSIGSLANGASATLTLVATATSAANVVNSATVDGNQTDPDATDDTSTANVDAVAQRLTVSSIEVNEASPFAVFTVTGAPLQAARLSLANIDSSGLSGLEIFDGSGWVAYTPGSTVSLNANGSLLVRTPLTPEQEAEFDNGETFTLTATNVENLPSVGTATIRDDGAGDKFPDSRPNLDGTPSKFTGPSPDFDDDRPLKVNNITVSESSPFVVFTVTGEPGQYVALALESGTATVGTDTGTALEYFDGTAWKPYTPGSFVAIPAGGNTLLVRVAVVNDPTLEGPETFRLRATNTGGTPARGTATLTDDGSNGKFFGPGNNTGTPAVGVADDDRARPVPPVPPAVPAPAVPVPIVLPPEAPLPPPQRFDSAITPTSPNRMLVMDRPPIGDILTRVEGFRVRVMEADLPMLMRDKGITDQFVENGRLTSFAMPYDAFMHSRDDAVISLSARLTDGRPLPGWIQFNAQAGTFQINAPAGLVEEYEILVTARDNNGREATASFKLNVGAGKRSEGVPTERTASWERFVPAGRPALTAQLREAGRPAGLLDRIMASQAVQERLQAASDTARDAGTEGKPADRAAASAARVKADNPAEQATGV